MNLKYLQLHQNLGELRFLSLFPSVQCRQQEADQEKAALELFYVPETTKRKSHHFKKP